MQDESLPLCKSNSATRSTCLQCGCKICTLAIQLVQLDVDKNTMDWDPDFPIRLHNLDPGKLSIIATPREWYHHATSLYVKEKHAISSLPVRPGVSGNTGSKDSWKRAKEWLNECLQRHSCSLNSPNPAFVPRRVLDLQASCASRIALYEGEKHEGDKQVGTYACLSHRWGASQPLKTTKTSILGFKRGIAEAVLPKTFLDTITVVRYLGIRYLWIDSLCILQDDNEDWNREASLMADIFQNATITIAATASRDAHSGLFQYNKAFAHKELSTLTLNPDHKGIFLGDFEASKYHGLEDPSELLLRGWVLQERLLSPRVLHFHHELVYECREKRLCECEFSDIAWIKWSDKHAFKIHCDELYFKQINNEVVYRHWEYVLAYYSTLQLTFASDVLPALSGLANFFNRYIGGIYVAGLWDRFLISELSWKARTPRSCRRRTPWVAPTFSWAAVVFDKPSTEALTEIRYSRDWGKNSSLRWIYRDGDYNDKLEGAAQCDVLDVTTTHAGLDPMGHVTTASVVLKGLLYPVTIQGLYDLSSPCEPPVAADEEKYFNADFDFTRTDQAQHGVTIGMQAYCFLLRWYDVQRATKLMGIWDGACGLVLRKVGDQEGMQGVFERVGIMRYRGRTGRIVQPVQENRYVSWVEEIKGRAREDLGVVINAVVKIV